MMRKVHEHALRSGQQLLHRTAHRATQHAHGENYVWAGLRRAVEKRADERLVGREKVSVDGTCCFAGQGILYRFRQGLRGRGARFLE
eukprot:2264064-Pleurochrysis_carterae.AAC.3